MYSLVSSPVLGFDLARLEGGPAAADLLLTVMALTRDDLPLLADRLPDDSIRAELWQQVGAAAARQPTMRTLDPAGPPASLVNLLQRAPIGTLSGLLHCVRHDVLDWSWDHAGGRAAQSVVAARATSVVCDVLVSCYLSEQLPAPTRRGLAGGWVAAARRLPPRPIDLGPQQRTVSGLLVSLAGLHRGELDRLMGAAGRIGTDARWAAAMHSASWAVHLSGRLRPAAAAQLMLVRAVHDAGVPVADRAAGGWNALSGAVHALVVRDLLDLPTMHELCAPYLAAFGPAGLA